MTSAAGDSKGVDEHEADTNATAAAASRAALSRLVQRTLHTVRASTIGQLPHRPPVKVIGKLTDHASNALSWHATITDAHAQSEGEGVARLFRTSLGIAWQFVRGTAMGVVLFSTYSYVKDRIHVDETRPLHVFGKETASGSIAGIVHGVCNHTLERALRNPSSLAGTAVSHAMSHGSLFGTYGLTKTLLLDSNDERESYKGIACIAAAGCIAGMVQEAVSIHTTEAETEGLASLRPSLASALTRMPLRQIIMAAPASALGFLAFEYAESVIGEREEK
eukprot:m.117954 g.117954  ORF g.117954 m.117954 type:complete len:278 (-) comp16110_c0_seq4:2313-3146(-)